MAYSDYPIKYKRSSTPGSVPSSLLPGELAINLADGKLFTSNGSSIKSIASHANVQTFDANGTWVRPPVGSWIWIMCWGGGGSGGLSATSAGGGGGGFYNQRLVPFSEITSNVTVTIGAGGNGRTGTAQTGMNGGSTTFGSHLTANGGVGGGTSTSLANGGAGGGYGTSAAAGSYAVNTAANFYANAAITTDLQLSGMGGNSTQAMNAKDGILGFGGGGGTQNATPIVYNAGNAFDGGAPGGGGARPTGVVQPGGVRQACSYFVIYWADISTSAGGAGGNNTTDAANGVGPGSGGGGAVTGNVPSGNGASGRCVVITW